MWYGDARNMDLLVLQLWDSFPGSHHNAIPAGRVLELTSMPRIPGCCPIVRQLKTMAISELGRPPPPPQHCWRRYIWSWFVDFPWECFRIERRWGNFWKMEFTVLVGVFCRHVNVSLGSKAATVSLLRVQPGLTCWWPNSQIVSEGEAKSWH